MQMKLKPWFVYVSECGAKSELLLQSIDYSQNWAFIALGIVEYVEWLRPHFFDNQSGLGGSRRYSGQICRSRALPIQPLAW